MKEYIVLAEEEDLYYNTFSYHELIRCKDCKYFTDCGCIRMEGMVFCKEDDYCSKAEKEDPEA